MAVEHVDEVERTAVVEIVGSMQEHDVGFVEGDERKGVVRGRVIGIIIGSDRRDAERVGIVVKVCHARVVMQAVRIGIDIPIDNEEATVVGVLLGT